MNREEFDFDVAKCWPVRRRQMGKQRSESEQQDAERQPIQPEVGGDTSKEGSEGKATLETSEQSLFDILED